MSETDSYLRIAEDVISRVRMPLSTGQIINLAYLHGLMPSHLHGSTQHKTLGARLSEDILKAKAKSRFFRTKPGRFFLRSFLRDKSLPLDYRTPIVARRRRRELKTRNIACISKSLLHGFISQGRDGSVSCSDFSNIIRNEWVCYRDHRDIDDSLVSIHAYVLIVRGGAVLTHSKGSYSEQRRSFLGKTMLGFPVPLCHDDMNLFEIETHGIVSAGLTATAIDLDLEFSAEFPSFEEDARLDALIPIKGARDETVLIGVIFVQAPENFEPAGRRLAVSDLNWVSWDRARLTPGLFDPWSRNLLRHDRYLAM